MDHTSAGALNWERGPEETFTGIVWMGPMSRAPERTVAVLGVLFEPGARTFWHSHPDGQVLYVASGFGKVGNEDETVEISAGDVIYTPAGERHWHGAGPASYMMHLSITSGGATAWEPAAVTDDEYRGGAS
jgi:quercetin dioxygenase-like cupin family protein